jgi:hypothetical protein
MARLEIALAQIEAMKAEKGTEDPQGEKGQ